MSDENAIVVKIFTILCVVFIVSFIPIIVEATEITSISPTIVMPGETTLTINGSGFGTDKGNVCYEGGSYYSPCTYSWESGMVSWTDTKIKVIVDSSAESGNIEIQYYKPGEYSKTNLIGPTIFIPPTISDIDDIIYIKEDSLIINGDSFGDVDGRVLIDGINARTNSWTDTRVSVTVPSLSFSTYEGYKDVPVVVYATNTNTDESDIESNSLEITVYKINSDDPYSYLQAYLPILGITNSWNVTLNRQVIVAVIDDGIYINHPDLRDNIWIHNDEIIGNGIDDDNNGYIDDIYGYDFFYDTDEMTTTGTHGTMVAGIIGAKRDNTIGVAGINSNVKLMSLIVCDSSGCPTASVIEAIYYAVNNGAKVINLSLGTWATTGYTSAYDDAIRYANDHGVVIVAAAGNGDVEGGIGQDLSIIPQSPVCNDANRNAIIGVGAVTDDRYLTSWSNFSGCTDVYAPGLGIVSTSVPADVGEFYYTASGTSFSAPMITGIISLLLQKYPSMPPSEVISRIYKHSSDGIIDAIAFLAESYSPPVEIPKVLGYNYGTPFIVTGTKTGGGPEVRIFDVDGSLLNSFNAYDENFWGGVNVAVGDIDGDGRSEIITSTRNGGIPTIKVFDPEGNNLGWDFDAYDSKFRGGINIAVGDIEGDGLSEIAVAPMSGGAPHVRIFGLRDGSIIPTTESFMAYAETFRGGIAISIGDIDSDGIGDIITSPTSNGGPHIRVFGVRDKRYVPVTLGIMAYAESFRGGINSTVGDVTNNGRDEILTGIVSAGGPHIRIFGIGRGKGVELLSPGFMAYDSSSRGGVAVAAIDTNGDGYNEIITGVGGGDISYIKLFSKDGKLLSPAFAAYSSNYRSGITLAAGYF